MKGLTPGRTLLLGLALILGSNAVVLAGVAWNRSGEEARLQLSQRELGATRDWGSSRENSGVALQLHWRVLRTVKDEPSYDYGYSYGGDTEWLDRAKLEALGFDLSAPLPDPLLDERYERQLPRPVFLVLEFDGPAYRAALRRAEAWVQVAKKGSKEVLERERTESSRLFVVDAGLDADALRAKYPDRGHYAVVPGKVSLQTYRVKRPMGYVHGPSVADINVPTRFHGAVRAPKFEASVAFGRRMEPWLVEVKR